MEVTEEMIKAVHEHDIAESRRKAREAHERKVRENAEKREKLRQDYLASVREIVPELTETQFDALSETFAYYEEDRQEIC